VIAIQENQRQKVLENIIAEERFAHLQSHIKSINYDADYAVYVKYLLTLPDKTTLARIINVLQDPPPALTASFQKSNAIFVSKQVFDAPYIQSLDDTELIIWHEALHCRQGNYLFVSKHSPLKIKHEISDAAKSYLEEAEIYAICCLAAKEGIFKVSSEVYKINKKLRRKCIKELAMYVRGNSNAEEYARQLLRHIYRLEHDKNYRNNAFSLILPAGEFRKRRRPDSTKF